MTQENSFHIDFVRFVCAAMVVAIHSGCPWGQPCDGAWFAKQLFWRDGITLIAVPFFFICSGYFVAKHLNSWTDWLLAVRKRVRTLVVPFFLWSFVFVVIGPFIIGLIADLLSHRPLGTTPCMLLRNQNWFEGVGFCWKLPSLEPLWYVRNLFFFVVTAPLLMFLVRRFGRVWLSICFVASLLYWFLPENDFKTFLLRFYSVLGMFYFSLGLYLHEKGVDGFSRLGLFLGGGGGKMLCAGMVALLWAVKLFFAATGYECVQHVFESISIPFAMLLVWRLTPAKRLPRWLANMSFPIFVLHYIVFQWLNVFFKQFSVFSTMPQACAVIRLFAGVFVSIVIAHLLRRFFPRFARIAFGDR